MKAGLVVGSVTTSEYLVLYVFWLFLAFWWRCVGVGGFWMRGVDVMLVLRIGGTSDEGGREKKLL
ncbi:uncharacterized protein CLUP02_06117 [Colletotrichum lupini]|uniref:Transmembrane protein n=1 Tax=Colletotrichum lupini TaxID=145971 RepID=A0A9Q8WER2_9PEZI|nr:uncharacterized protein CLUP02_06117 [Colletotrichum lupini]UQC80634.1 hypothetical protein CLUP02_06117 [Colletotrichum lupini]